MVPAVTHLFWALNTTYRNKVMHEPAACGSNINHGSGSGQINVRQHRRYGVDQEVLRSRHHHYPSSQAVNQNPTRPRHLRRENYKAWALHITAGFPYRLRWIHFSQLSLVANAAHTRCNVREISQGARGSGIGAITGGRNAGSHYSFVRGTRGAFKLCQNGWPRQRKRVRRAVRSWRNKECQFGTAIVSSRTLQCSRQHNDRSIQRPSPGAARELVKLNFN